MRNWREWLPRVLVESALIVFSILLALAVDEWRQERERAALARRALETFTQELEQNRAQVQGLLPYHARLESAFTRLDSLGTVRSMADWQAGVPEWSGFRPALLQGTAWQTALATGALAHLDYKTVAVLSRVYAVQDRLDALFRARDFDLSDEQARAFVREADIYLEDATTQEQILLGEYTAALEVLQRELDRPAPGQARAAAP